jgi:uncharacterized protein YqgC (DUF456 family)
MDILLYIAALLLVIAGFVGCVLPAIPGPPLAFLGLLAIHFTGDFEYTTSGLVVLGILAAGVTILDNFMSVIGTKLGKGSRWGFWGSILGTFIGIIFFAPWGFILGPFLGALLGELVGGKEVTIALRSGLAALIGFLTGIFFKLLYCIAVVVFIFVGNI